MSHISCWQIAVTGITREMLMQALKSFVEKIGAHIVQNYNMTAYENGQHLQADVTIKSDAMPFGMGFRLDAQGKVFVMGDGYQNKEFDRISALAPGYINAFKAAAIARSKNPTVHSQLEIQGNDVILVNEGTY